MTPRAERDIAGIYARIQVPTSDAALKWYLGLRDSIRSLRDSPTRCPRTPENDQLRHLLYGHKPHIYRVIFRIMEKPKQVEVLHIRHGAMDKFGKAEQGDEDIVRNISHLSKWQRVVCNRTLFIFECHGWVNPSRSTSGPKASHHRHHR